MTESCMNYTELLHNHNHGWNKKLYAVRELVYGNLLYERLPFLVDEIICGADNNQLYSFLEYQQ